MTDGIAQGVVSVPFSSASGGLDELPTAVLKAMCDLSVDSNMIGQEVHVVGSVDGRLESDAVVPVTDELPLSPRQRRQHIL